MTENAPGIAVITGPTATGKTRLGVELALALSGEIVSGDSMQIYKKMNIGTAKPSPEEMRGVPHHMLDICDPLEDYSAAKYVKDAALAVDDILNRGRLPIIVGGTGLYIDSLISGRSFADSSQKGELHRELEEKYDRVGGEVMLRELIAFDPQRGERLLPGDKRRIVRAFEVYELTGKTISQHDLETRLIPPRYKAKTIALSYEDRGELYNRIEERVDEMMEEGLLREVEALLRGGVERGATAMQAIGYRELAGYIEGELELEEAVELIKRNSRRYAKRQLTWLRRKEDILWILWKGGVDFVSARRKATEFICSDVVK